MGLNHGEINSSAAIIIDGKVIAGAPEERFSRRKKTKEFPINSIEFCLKNSKINLKDCDYVAQSWNPAEYWKKFNPLISSFRIKREDYFYTVPDNLYNLTKRKTPNWVLMEFPKDNPIPSTYYVKHHLAHAANAFFLSPYNDAVILTCDLRGEVDSVMTGFGLENKIEVYSTQQIPHSLGIFYAAFTQLLGYRPDNDEWKVMALSAFDVEYEDILKKIRKTVFLEQNGSFELDQSFFQGAIWGKPKLYTDKLVELLGNREGKPNEEPDNWHYAIAKAMQIVSEEIVFHILDFLYERTKCENLVLGGGYFMNSVCNGKIINKTKFKNVYVSHSPADVGNSLGAALFVAHCIHHEKRNWDYNSSFIGPSFSSSDILSTLKRRKIKFSNLSHVAKEIAKILSDGKILGLFNGKMEFGERALGHRSIIADPRIKTIKDEINSIIKYRESYRPFAPAVLAEKVDIFFDVEKGFNSNYMEKVVFVKKEFREKLPAITHVDGSARVQTVQKEDNSLFCEILNEFEKISNFPIILNTSFNVNGEPVVNTPDDALNTFYNSGLEYLVLENYLIRK